MEPTASEWVAASCDPHTLIGSFFTPKFLHVHPLKSLPLIESLRWLVELGGCYAVWIIEEKQRKKEGARCVNWPIALHPEPASLRNPRLTLHSRASTHTSVWREIELGWLFATWSSRRAEARAYVWENMDLNSMEGQFKVELHLPSYSRETTTFYCCTGVCVCVHVCVWVSVSVCLSGWASEWVLCPPGFF